jgi:uncharacterized protein DUF2877
VIAVSTSRALLPLIAGPELAGTVAGRGYLDFDDLVLALTPPGGPRMPNGIETAARGDPGTPVRIGLGRLLLGSLELLPGVTWDPVPEVHFRPPGARTPRPDLDQLAGRGPGLTPAGDDILCGYVAGISLFYNRREEAAEIAQRAAARTSRLSATLLRHAAVGELPEPAHDYLANGDSRPLAAFGHSSGHCLRFGLQLAAAADG